VPPESIRDKIFQPFFTTKPTGQGTGLGLSLAYDIVTKGHGGKLEVESTPNLGTTFVMTLEQVWNFPDSFRNPILTIRTKILTTRKIPLLSPGGFAQLWIINSAEYNHNDNNLLNY